MSDSSSPCFVSSVKYHVSASFEMGIKEGIHAPEVVAIRCGHCPYGSKVVELETVSKESPCQRIRGAFGQCIRYHATIDQDPSLKQDQLGMLRAIDRVIADCWVVPAVDGDVELGFRFERRDKTSHVRLTKRARRMGELVILDDMAVDLEFLQRNASIMA